jgi:hypothetical protein
VEDDDVRCVVNKPLLGHMIRPVSSGPVRVERGGTRWLVCVCGGVLYLEVPFQITRCLHVFVEVNMHSVQLRGS